MYFPLEGHLKNVNGHSKQADIAYIRVEYKQKR
jgi:hypothetical protein